MPFFRWSDLPAEVLPAGVTRRTVDGERVQMCVYELKASSWARPHAHESEQIAYLVEGRVRFRVGDEERLMESGDVVCIPSNVEHETWVLDQDAVVIHAFSPVRRDFAAKTDSYLRG